MAKQTFNIQKITKLIGRLDKNEDNKFIVTVEDKDTVQEYDLEEILNSVLGSVVSFQSEENL